MMDALAFHRSLDVFQPLHKPSLHSFQKSPLVLLPLLSFPVLPPFRRTHLVVSSQSMSMASPGASKDPDDNPRPFGVLFVCLGNICRSPTAEAVFRHAVEKRGLASYFHIDSAGTIDYHKGEPADARMKAAAIKRGVDLTSISRPICPSDFKEFDLILAMDRQNKEDILKAHRVWKSKQKLPLRSEEKVKLICEYCKKHNETEVPDPYYGGQTGFEKVLDLLADACESLLDSIVPNLTKPERNMI